MRILIMGLPGSGKTTLARELNKHLQSKWYNADDIRASENDWDFSNDGRIRQALRMKTLAEDSESYGFKYVICDFVAPTESIRNIFDADFTIWMNTISESRFNDTNSLFEPPTKYDIQIRELERIDLQFIIEKITYEFNSI
jgi:adenylylsulfate kinase